jgi:mRNA interferase MazF
VRRGELYRVWKPAGDPKKHRVFVVVSRPALIASRFSTVICAPVFTNGQGLATEVSIGVQNGMKHESWIMCDNLMSLRKSELRDYVGTLSSSQIGNLNRALKTALDLE